MILSQEQRLEKAIEHMIVFAQFVAHEYCQNDDEDAHVMCAAAARVYRQRQYMETGGSPVDWIGNSFAQYMRELVIDGAPVVPPRT